MEGWEHQLSWFCEKELFLVTAALAVTECYILIIWYKFSDIHGGCDSDDGLSN